ncbi:MAG: quinoprotein relay system zinc metallohydrolase 2 [Steroidobacteraceae bacterium]
MGTGSAKHHGAAEPAGMAARERKPGVLSLRMALVALVAFLNASPARSAQDPLVVQQIAAGVFVHFGKPLALDAPGHDDIANIGFIVGTRCVAVIDTGGSVRVGRALRAAIRQHTPLPVCYVINTHVHVDHVLGNAAFKSDGAKFVGHERLGAQLAQSRQFFLKNYANDLDPPATADQIIAPDLSVPVGSDVDLDLGGRHLQLRAWPKAHTDSDLTVYDEVSGTLWTGDLLFVRRTPVIDGSIKGWLAAMEVLAAMPAKHVIPGHGNASNDLAAALKPQRQYLQALLEEVRAEIAAGKPLQQAMKEVNPPGQADWLLWNETHPRNVARVYQELEWE